MGAIMRTRVGVLASVLLVSAACGKIKGGASDAGPEPDAAAPPDAAPPGPCEPGGAPTPEEGYQCLIEGTCTMVTGCLPLLTVEDCVNSDLQLFDVDSSRVHHAIVLDAVARGTIEFHPEAVSDCYATLTELGCANLYEKYLGGGDDFTIDRICPGVFTGTVAMDGACFTNLECESPGSLCNGVDACGADELCCAGTCVIPAGIDGSCGANPCEPGTYCVGGLCRPGDADSPCESSSQCDIGLWCNAGVCAPELESGAACTVFEQCPGLEICLIPPGAKAGTCARIDQPDAPCNDSCFGMVCVQPDAASLGTCTPLLDEEGADCADFYCAADFECSPATGQCDPIGEVGDVCSNEEGNRCRQSLFCDTELTGEATGHCSAPLADNEPCTQDEQCQSGVCVGDLDPVCAAYPGCYE